MEKLYIRSDGNEKIGTGHIMRCLSIADAVREAGGTCIFVVADSKMEAVIRANGFPMICLHSVWDNLDYETEKMEQLISSEKIRFLLVDSYFVTHDYMMRLHRLTQVGYIDDLDQFTYPCSLLINYNLYAGQIDYLHRYPSQKLFLGPEYVPLRREFSHLPSRKVRTQVKDVLVTTGGSDPMNIACELVQSAKQEPLLQEINFHIVAGRFHQHLPMLQNLVQTEPGIALHHNVKCMSELMIGCDLAVSAGGSTLYELSACGTPTICFAWADNQLENVASFGRAGMYAVGDIRADWTQTMEKIVEAIIDLKSDQGQRQELSDRLQNLVDGRGAARIAALLRDFPEIA